jgi:hypothetical protein
MSCLGSSSWLMAGLVVGLFLQDANPQSLLAGSHPSGPAPGPLRLHPTNPRYFTDGSGKAIYLTGSHTWYNLQDGGPGDPPPVFDYNGYLDFMQAHNHNFMRLWAWEQGGVPGTNGDVYIAPMPYARTGPGVALDGKPKFDLYRFNPAYFDRLRSRIIAARNRGIYVAIMLFQGWSIGKKPGSEGNPWPGHPYNKHNNINGIDGDADGDGEGTEVHTLQVPAVTAVQEAYVRQVVDTVNNLDNVLYEVGNEVHGDSTQWQYHIINYVKNYEAGKPKQHPVGMTYQWPPHSDNNNPVLFKSPADWISPGEHTHLKDYKLNPPLVNGSKVIVVDTDHLSWQEDGGNGNGVWVWKSFMSGLNPIYMDDPLNPNPEWPNTNVLEEARAAMGHTLTYANKMHLAEMTPQGGLSSTTYCLANPGTEYLVYLPSEPHGIESWIGSTRFVWRFQPLFRKFRELFRLTATVDLSAALRELSVEWFNPRSGNIAETGTVTGGSNRTFKAPFFGHAVLYLKSKSAPSSN